MHDSWKILKAQGARRRKSLTLGKLKTLQEEMKDISEEQKSIREGQIEVRERFKSIELECEQLRKETELIIQSSSAMQTRLRLMFEALEALGAVEGSDDLNDDSAFDHILSEMKRKQSKSD
ncbi:hypothetical protein PTKIN_Ptkin01aG0020900 [Pterospermum kingtungense]